MQLIDSDTWHRTKVHGTGTIVTEKIKIKTFQKNSSLRHIVKQLMTPVKIKIYKTQPRLNEYQCMWC